MTEQRIVQMVFDNKQFEANAQQSIKTLGNLEKSLNFSGVAKGFGTLTSAAKDLTFNGIISSAESAGEKLSALGIIGVTALQNITNSAVNAGTQLVKSLSVDQVTAGWGKYENKTSSVQTIMAATNDTWEQSANYVQRLNNALDTYTNLPISNVTDAVKTLNGSLEAGKELTDKQFGALAKETQISVPELKKLSNSMKETVYEGSQMDYVNGQLEKLNWFTDETSYNFVDMTSNIGKFTSNGIALDSAVTSMQGIATWAAISGANSQNASHAMYNLSQALSSGAVKLQDWKSIENANMGTAEFKQQVIETAAALGELNKKGDKFYSKKQNPKTGEYEEVSISSFNQTLSSGWFTNDVLTKVLDKYGQFTDQLYNLSEKTGYTATELLGYLDDYTNGNLDLAELSAETGMSVDELTEAFTRLGSEELTLGKRSFRAAQEAKTFSEAIDATKDAVSTGWMNTFELIFGNYEEAKVLWTNVANELYDIFASSAEARNELLGEWKDAGGRDSLFEALGNMWGFIKDIASSIQNVSSTIFPPATAENLLDLTDKLKAFSETLVLSEEDLENIEHISTLVFSALKAGMDIITITGKAVLQTLAPLGRIGTELVNILYEAADVMIETSGFASIVDRISIALNTLVSYLEPLVDELAGNIGEVMWDIYDSGNFIASAIKELFGIVEAFKPLLLFIYDLIMSIFEQGHYAPILAISKACGVLYDIIRGIAGVLKPIVRLLVSGVIRSATALIGIVEIFGDIFQSTQIHINKFIRTVGTGFGKVYKSFSKLLLPLQEFFNGFRGAKEYPTSFVKIVSNGLKTILKILTSVASFSTNVLSGLFEGLYDVGQVLGGIVNGAFNVFSALIDRIHQRTASFGGLLDTVKIALSDIWGVIKNMLPPLGDILMLLGTGLGNTLDAIASNLSTGDFVAALDILNAGLISSLLTNLNKMVEGTGNPIQYFIDKIVGAGKDLAKPVTGFFGKLTESLENMQKIVDADVMIKIATAVGILAASLFVIGLVDSAKLTGALAAITTLFVDLFGSVGVFNKYLDSGSMKTLSGAVTDMIKISAAVFILSIALKKVASIDSDKLGGAYAALTGLVADLVAAIEILGHTLAKTKFGNIKMASDALIKMSVALVIMAQALKSVASIDSDKLGPAYAVLTGMIAELVGVIEIFGNTMKKTKFGEFQKAAQGCIYLAVALEIMAHVLSNLAQLSFDELAQGLTGIGGLLAELGIFLNYVNSSGFTPKTGFAIIELAAALLLMGQAVSNLGNLPMETLGKGLLAVGLSLAFLGVFLNNIPKDMAGTGLGILLVGASLLILANAVSMFGSMDTHSLVQGLFGLVVIMGGLVLMIDNLPKDLLVKAAGMMVMALALGMLAGVVALLSLIPFDKLVTGLIGLGGILAEVVIAMQFMQGSIAGAAALLIMAVGVSLLAGSLLLLSLIPFPAMVAGLIGFGAILGILILAAVPLAALAPALLTAGGAIALFGVGALAAGAGLLLFAVAIPALAAAIVNLVFTILGIIPRAIRFIGDILTSICDVIIEFVPKLGEAILVLITSALDLITGLITTFVDVLKGLGSWLFESGFVQGILDTISKVLDAAAEILDGIKTAFGDGVGAFIGMGGLIIDGLIKGIQDNIGKAIKAVQDGVASIVDKAKDFLGIHSPSRVFAGIGKYIDLGLAEGISDYSKIPTRAGEDMADTVMGSVNDLLDANNALNISPTIRPVVDLDDLSSGLKTADGFLSRNSLMAHIGAQDIEIQNGNDMAIIIDHMEQIYKAVVAGGNVYLDQKTLVGAINRQLGAYV